MSLKETINNDIKTALLGGNRFEAEVLKNFKAAMLNEEVSKSKRETGLEDGEIEQLLAREIKKRSESADLYTKAGRQELADNELKERDVLSRYLPEQVSEDEIKQAIDNYIKETGSNNMGQIIGAIKAKFGNSADGALVARLVKESL